jgi:hypothetical protein
MISQANQSKLPRGEGVASLIIGSVTASVYVLMLAGAFVVSSKSQETWTKSLRCLPGLAFMVCLCAGGIVVNGGGIVLGALGLRAPASTKQRRLALVGIVLNLFPLVFYCLMTSPDWSPHFAFLNWGCPSSF